MAQIQDRKINLYSQKQSVREEALAPTYLETAGDVLVRELSKKQLNTEMTLEDQLKVTQNFEKGFEMSPDLRKGVTTLEEVQKRMKNEENEEENLNNVRGVQDLSKILQEAGLNRHEIELALCEKPNSDISKLYAFALGNKKHGNKTESVERLLPNHPINHLKEIYDEYFEKSKKNDGTEEKLENKVEETKEETNSSKEKRKGRKRKHRKRKKAGSNASDTADEPLPSTSETSEFESVSKNFEKEEIKITRPSLWDVKDMKKWCEPKKEYGCKTRTLYTIKDGKIIKLEDLNREEVT